MTCRHPGRAIRFFAHGAGGLVCDDCGARRRLTEHEFAKREAALAAYARFARQYEGTPEQPAEAHVLQPLGEGVGYRGRVPDGREFGIGFEFDGRQPFPRPPAAWPTEIAVPLRSLA